MNCPSCGKAEMAEENFYRCPSCGDDYTGQIGALVIDAHVAALRAEYSRIFAALSEAREVLRACVETWEPLLADAELNPQDNPARVVLARAARLLAPPPEASGDVYRDNGEGWRRDKP